MQRGLNSGMLLHYAVEKNNLEIVKELLEEKEININWHDRSGATPIHIAVKNKNVDMLRLLLDKGADPDSRDRKYHQPIDLAENNQDILSLLDPSMQFCLIKSMRILGYFSNDGGICQGLAIAALFSIKKLEDFYRLLFSIRRLHLNEYTLCLMTDDVKPEPGKLYVKKVDGFLEYSVIAPSGEIVKDKFTIKMNTPFTIENLQPLLPKILKITSERGHTKLSDLEIMQLNHDQLIEKAELEALKAMECKKIDDLSPTENITFRQLTLQKTKELRDLLTRDEREKETLLIEIRALFETIELIMRSARYPNLFPFKHPHTGDKKSDAFVFQLFKPAYIKKEDKEFNGAYTKEELIDYFKQLRFLVTEETSIKEPIILLLSSPDHYITIIYDTKINAWRIIDANHLPRNEKEIDDYVIKADTEIAERVADSFFPGYNNAIFYTQIFSIVENPEQENEIKKDKPSQLTSIIDRWYKALASSHIITADKAQMLVHDNGTYLYLAASKGDADTIKELLRVKANINQRSCFGTTPLIIAAQNGPVDTVKALFNSEQKVDINLTRSADNETALNRAAAWGNADIVEALLTATNVVSEINPNLGGKISGLNNVTPLHTACLHGATSIVKLLLEAKLQTQEIDPDPIIVEGATPLFIAAQDGNEDIAKLLLNTGKVDPNKPLLRNGNTSLHIAIYNKNLEIAKMLIDSNKINLDASNHKGYTPIISATESGHSEIVKILLKKDTVDPNKQLISNGETALHIAIKENITDIINLLLQSDKINLNVFDKDGITPLMRAAFCNQPANEDHTEVVKILLEAKCDVNLVRIKDGASPLYMAAQDGHYQVVKILLDAKADPNITLLMNGNVPKDYPNLEYPPSALEIAAKNGHLEIVKLLLAYKAKPFNKDPSHASISKALEKCYTYEAKDDGELKKHYASFNEMDSRIDQLRKQVQSVFSDDEMKTQTIHDQLYSAYDDYNNDIDLSTISKKLETIATTIIDAEQHKAIIESHEKYHIKKYVNLKQLLFTSPSSNQIDRSKELLKIALDAFITDYYYKKHPIHHALKNIVAKDFNDESLSRLKHAINSELRFIRFSRVANHDDILENLENLRMLVNSLSDQCNQRTMKCRL